MSEDVMTREEVAQKLEEKSSAIASRVEALESELPIKPKTLQALSRNKTNIKKGLAIGAGILLAGWLLRRRSKSDVGYSEAIERAASSIGREVRKNLSSGMEEAEAVSAALRKRPPVVNLGGRHAEASALSETFRALLKRTAVALSPVIIDMITEYLKRGREGSEKE